jgi:hypothetical protein
MPGMLPQFVCLPARPVPRTEFAQHRIGILTAARGRLHTSPKCSHSKLVEYEVPVGDWSDTAAKDMTTSSGVVRLAPPPTTNQPVVNACANTYVSLLPRQIP